MSKYQARKIFEKLDSLKISGLEAKINHAEHIEKEVKHQQTSTTKEVCPKCGKKLILRKGQYGNFLGSSGYPNCRYTQKP